MPIRLKTNATWKGELNNCPAGRRWSEKRKSKTESHSRMIRLKNGDH